MLQRCPPEDKAAWYLIYGVMMLPYCIVSPAISPESNKADNQLSSEQSIPQQQRGILCS